jgi:hypothetical protein
LVIFMGLSYLTTLLINKKRYQWKTGFETSGYKNPGPKKI